MPLKIEDGTGVADADSWNTESDATAWFVDRNVTEWSALSVANREAKLREAADYLMYAYRWPGQPATLVQRLPWPRAGVRSGNGYFSASAIPTQISDAQLLLAHESIIRGGILRRAPSDRQVIEETKSAKGFSKSLKYATEPVDSVSGLPRFPIVDNILRGIAVGNAGGEMAVVPLSLGR